jgi:hypothetical protein
LLLAAFQAGEVGLIWCAGHGNPLDLDHEWESPLSSRPVRDRRTGSGAGACSGRKAWNVADRS